MGGTVTTPPPCLRGVERDSFYFFLCNLQEASLKQFAFGSASSVGRAAVFLTLPTQSFYNPR